MESYYIGEIFSLSIMAMAVAMDAFSVSLGMGMQQLRLKKIAMIGIVIGLFHIFMPLIGIFLGKIISNQIGSITEIFSACLLVAIGLQMIIYAFMEDEKARLRPMEIGLFIFALTVSLDSFSVGLSLGLSQVKTFVAVMLFGAFSTCLTWMGLIIGRKVHGLLGTYSEILGGSILCGLGITIFFT